MAVEEITRYIFVWITRYIAYFCLVTIVTWATVSYLWGKKWETPVRDSGIYLLTIGVLTLILALRPTKTDAIFWPPITWFSFTMLMVMELLWMSFLLEMGFRKLRNTSTSLSERATGGPTSRYPNSPRV